MKITKELLLYYGMEKEEAEKLLINYPDGAE